MSGSFGGQRLEIAPGGGLDSPGFNTVVFNQGDQAFKAKLTAAAPAGVTVVFAENEFVLQPKTYKQVRVTVRVAANARPGDYDLVVRAEAAPLKAATGVSIPVAVGQTAKLKITGEPFFFDDLIGHWARDDVEALAKLGIARGVGNNRFDPDATLNRAQFTAFILRALDLKEVAPVAGRFADVPVDAWYAGVAEAAYVHGLVVSREAGVFAPNAAITREEIADLVARALAKAGRTITVADPEAVLAKFTDAAEISAWARPGAAAAGLSGIVGGRPGGRFAPRENATRAEAMVMLKRMVGRLGPAQQ